MLMRARWLLHCKGNTSKAQEIIASCCIEVVCAKYIDVRINEENPILGL